MVVKELYRVESRGYKNWILKVIDVVKMFVKAIGNFQELLKCHYGKTVRGNCSFRYGLLIFGLEIMMHFG
jgi:hypothetical protein